MYGSILDANPFGCGSFQKPLVSLTDESDTLARLGFVAVGTPVLSLGSVGSVAGAGSPRSLSCSPVYK